MSLPTRTLGKSSLTVPAIGLGCMGMSEFYGTAEDAENLKVLARALELGVNFWDTADMYGIGRNEELLAKALRGKREKVVLATKFGVVRGADASSRGINGSPPYVQQACEASLKRLGTDYIDLYYQHRVDPTVPIEDTVGAMARLVQQGKVRFLGLSEAAAATIRRAHAVHPITALQSEYSLWTRDPEGEILTTLRELGIGLVAYSPLGRGFLTGKLNLNTLEAGDYRTSSPRMQPDNLVHNQALLSQVQQLAEQKGCKPSQLALAWVLAQGKDIVPIPGTKRIQYLEENVAALQVQLTAQELRELTENLPQPAGERYPPGGMQVLNK